MIRSPFEEGPMPHCLAFHIPGLDQVAVVLVIGVLIYGRRSG